MWSIAIQSLLALLPNRSPMLLVDRILACEEGYRFVGINNVTINEPHFQGHFPGNPVFPGVLMIEGMAQTAGVLCLITMGSKQPSVYFLTIDKAKFRKPVVPGDTIEYHMTKMAHSGSMWWYRGVAKVRGAIVAEAEVRAMISDS